MWFTYVLISIKNGKFYTGYTSDITKRLIQHNRKYGSKYTSINAPYKLVFFEAFISKLDATKAEKFFKSGYGREVLKDKIKYSLEELNCPVV